MNIVDYLKGKVSYEVDTSNILVILEDRGVLETEDSQNLEIKTKDLCYADLLMFLVTVFTGGGETTKRGNWSESKAKYTITTTDRMRLKNIADSIYSKYNEKDKTYSLKDITNRW